MGQASSPDRMRVRPTPPRPPAKNGAHNNRIQKLRPREKQDSPPANAPFNGSLLTVTTQNGSSTHNESFSASLPPPSFHEKKTQQAPGGKTTPHTRV